MLRAIKAGLNDERQIAAFLGLDVAVTKITLGELAQDRYIDEGDGTKTYVVTDVGTKVIEEEREFVPQEETHTIIFDGILRRPVWISGERLLRPSEIDRATTIEIRPYPSTLPELEELKLIDVFAVLRSQYGGAEEFDRDVLALSRITRRSKVFRLAAGLAYKIIRGPEIQIAFVVDGVPHGELEQVFAEKGGARKMGFIKALEETGVERAIRRHLGNEVVQLLPDDTELQTRRQILAGARLSLEIAAQRAESEPTASNNSRLEDAQSRFEGAVHAIQSYNARPLEVYEIRDLLEDALASATVRIYVAVSEYWDSVLTRELLGHLESALKRRVDIRILEHIRGGVVETSIMRKADRAPEIAALMGRYKNFAVTQTKRRGFFFLIKDSQFAAIANRPLLGPASKTRMFRQFAGYMLQMPKLVEAYVSRVTSTYWSDGVPPK